MDPKTMRDPAQALLDWYDRHARAMPWRTPPADRRAGVLPDPYHVWLSEVMLQQTQVRTVHAYFLDFLARWPTVEALARAPADDVMKAWAGLGYYSRARNLKTCAETVWREHGGRFPSTAAELRKLPGIGAYTSAAIAAIAFDERIAVVDGNVERVVTRMHAIGRPLPEAKPGIGRIVGDMTPAGRPGCFAQAMMDLGATICTPRKPACALCPWRPGCAAASAGSQEDYPVKTAKAQKPSRRGAAFVAEDAQGRVLLRKRPEKGLLGGMSEPPTTAWSARADGETGKGAAPFPADWRRRGSISHSFTHFDLELEVWHARTEAHHPGNWVEARDLPGEALPTVMKKVVAQAIPDAFTRFGKARQKPEQ